MLLLGDVYILVHVSYLRHCKHILFFRDANIRLNIYTIHASLWYASAKLKHLEALFLIIDTCSTSACFTALLNLAYC